MKRWLPLVGIGIVTVLLLMGIVFLPNKKQTTQNPNASPTPLTMTKPSEPMMRVGDEILYQGDLDFELAYHPQRNEPKIKQILINKIINDSITLQAGQKEGLVTLSSDMYNAKEKNYLKRVQMVEKVKKNLANQADRIEGAFVSVWFYNNNTVGSLGYDKGKEFAYQKIKDVYDAVKDKRITIEQAGNRIKTDTSLAQVDTAYDVNAYSAFSKNPDQRITYDEGFDKQIRQLSEGELTEIVLLKDRVEQTGEMRDAVYMFAQVHRRVANGLYTNFDDWLTQNKKEYEINYY